MEATGHVLYTVALLSSLTDRKKQRLAKIFPFILPIPFADRCDEIVAWLSTQRNNLGGWDSTQDTVTALEAIILYTKIHKKQSQEMTVGIDSRHITKSIKIDQASAVFPLNSFR